MNKLEAMIEATTEHLCKCGALPAFKAVDKEVIEAENKLSNQLSRLFNRVENRMISELRARGYIPSDRASQLTFVRVFLDTLFGDFSDYIFEAALEQLNKGRLIAFTQLGKRYKLRYTVFDQFVSDRLRDRIYKFSRETFDKIIGSIADSLQKSYETGLGIDDAAEELKKEMVNVRGWKARQIARTEINSAQNEGLQTTYSQLGVQYKQWLTARDDRVRGHRPSDRANHIVLHGEVVPVNERFSNGLLMPGDRSTGNLAEFINCRCRIRAYIPRPGEIITATPYRP